MANRKKQTKQVILNGEKVTAYKYEGDSNWTVAEKQS